MWSPLIELILGDILQSKGSVDYGSRRWSHLNCLRPVAPPHPVLSDSRTQWYLWPHTLRCRTRFLGTSGGDRYRPLSILDNPLYKGVGSQERRLVPNGNRIGTRTSCSLCSKEFTKPISKVRINWYIYINISLLGYVTERKYKNIIRL